MISPTRFELERVRIQSLISAARSRGDIDQMQNGLAEMTRLFRCCYGAVAPNNSRVADHR